MLAILRRFFTWRASRAVRLAGQGNEQWPIGFGNVRFGEAVSWFVRRTQVTKDEWLKLDADARRKAFTVANVAQLDQVKQAWDAVGKAVSEGTTFEDFKREMAPALGLPEARLETIFRTNVQLAYSAGRYQQHMAVKDLRPFWKFSSVLDGRTSSACRACNGKIVDADADWWKNHTPPLHFNCRSTVVSLTEAQAAKAGVTSAPPTAPAQDGFGGTPGASEWKPDIEKKTAGAPELRLVYDEKHAATPNAPPPAPTAPPAAPPPAAPPAAPPPGGQGGDGGGPPKGGPFRPPAPRHSAARVGKSSIAKSNNTVALPGVPIASDAAEISAGLAIEAVDRDGQRIFAINGRVYGVEGSTLYPTDGDGLVRLSRGAFKALKLYNKLGLCERAEAELDRAEVKESEREKARKVWRAIHSGAR